MKHCLIVDDSEVIRKVARLIVEQMGYITSEADNGQTALIECRKAIPNLILLDWHMPELGAHDFLAAFKDMHGSGKAQILYCTTENNHGDIARAFAGGISGFILKPFDRASLQSKIMELTVEAA